ncbi:MAG: hypothetical protein AUK54_09295 [Helicobacteraceae bacterium CG2_30_36_10]|nr:MAG: hypothetical protein AUK54_09295 [Helicobacteraceae bacterium CG2_30_36_10]
MKTGLTLLLSTSLVIALFNGCGSGSDSSPNTSPDLNNTATETQTIVQVVDGYVINATVSDSNGKLATEIGNGSYKFAGNINYPLIAKNGFLADTNKVFDIEMLTYEGDVISPITSIIGDGRYSEFKDMFANAIGTGSLGVDYIDSNNSQMAKAAQMAYLMIKDDLGSELLVEIKSSMPTSMNDLALAMQGAVNRDTSLTAFQKLIKNGYINTIATSNVTAQNMELFLAPLKQNLDKTGDNDDYDGDGLSNKLESVFGFDMTNPLDINGSADNDSDGISNSKEMNYALMYACKNGNYGLDANYDTNCNFKYDTSLELYEQQKWTIQTTTDGNIISIDEQYATDNSKSYFSLADTASSIVPMTFDAANTFCSELNYGEFTDWRLPTSLEVSQIFSADGLSTTGGLNLFFYADNLQNASSTGVYQDAFIWTSQESDTDNAYAGYLWRKFGGLSFRNAQPIKAKSEKYSAMCVREYR